MGGRAGKTNEDGTALPIGPYGRSAYLPTQWGSLARGVPPAQSRGERVLQLNLAALLGDLRGEFMASYNTLRRRV